MATAHQIQLVASQTYRANQSPFTSPAADWPANTMEAGLVLASTTFTSPVNKVTFSIDKSTDGGATWALVTEAQYVGGPGDRHGNPIQPGIIFTPDSSELLVPFMLRARMAVTGQITGPLNLLWTTEP